MTCVEGNVYRIRFTTKSLLLLTTAISLLLAVGSGMVAQSFSLLAQNLLVFYINAALLTALAIGISSVLGQNRIAVVVASLVGFATVSLLVWAIVLMESRFGTFAGLQILAQIPVAAAISRSNLLVRDEPFALEDQPHSSHKLKQFADENFAKQTRHHKRNQAACWRPE
ncbi:MAG: hypothetical protein U0930_03355 [Pirellulales bacterium]